MAYTETTNTNYGQRLSGSIKGSIGGLLMFIVGTCLLWWNEGRAVKADRAINEAQTVAIHVDDVSTVDAALDGKLIHASALADTKETLTDELFGIRTVAIQLIRDVEYYQWVEDEKRETRDKMGGGQETVTTYTYQLKWVDNPIASAEFKDPQYQTRNFVLTNVDDKKLLAGKVTFGAYTLPEFIKRSIGGSEQVAVEMTDELIRTWNNRLHTTASASADTLSLVHAEHNTVYFGRSPATPQVGDVRITFTKVMPADISIVAQVNGSTFDDYTAKNGKSFSRVEMGTISAADMFQHAHSENNTLTWILRLAGWLMVVFGLKGMFGLLPALFKVIPFLGNIVGAGIGIVCWIFGVAWSLIVVAIAWLAYRPIIGGLLLAAAIAAIIFLKTRSKKAHRPSGLS